MQYFLPERSCVTQFLTSMKYWADKIQKGNPRPVDVLCVDFKKAFDNKVPHKKLSTKLKAYMENFSIGYIMHSFLLGRLPLILLELM